MVQLLWGHSATSFKSQSSGSKSKSPWYASSPSPENKNLSLTVVSHHWLAGTPTIVMWSFVRVMLAHLLLTAEVCFSLASKSLTAARFRHSSTCWLSSVSSPPSHCNLLPQTGHRGTSSISLLVSSVNGGCRSVNSDEAHVLLLLMGKPWSVPVTDVDVLELLSVQRRLNMDTMVAESSARSCDIRTPDTMKQSNKRCIFQLLHFVALVFSANHAPATEL